MICSYGDDIRLTKRMRKLLACHEQVTYGKHCDKHLDYSERRERDYDNTPQEKRQEYLDNLHKGMTIGEAYTATGISFDVALEITNRAIGEYKYLKRHAA